MKPLSFLLLIPFVFIACSRDTAFDRFSITQHQKLAENSIQSSKIKYKNSIDGVVNVVYLNEVLPKEYNNHEYFYLYLYTKDKDPKLTFLLNKKPASRITKLDANNQFTKLISFDAPWSQYYLVEFPKQGDKLHFKLKNKQFNSDILKFEKDK